jgi:fused signal recognition particle receptor
MFKKWFGFGKKNEEKEQEQEENIDVVLEDEAEASDEQIVESSEEIEPLSAQEEAIEEEVSTVEIEVVEEIVEKAEALEETERFEAEGEAEEDAIEAELEASIEALIEAESEPVEEEISILEVFQEETVVEPEKKAGFFEKLKQGLTKTTKAFTDRIDNLFNQYDKIDDDLYEELEEILIMADIGMETTLKIVERLKAELVNRKISDPALVKPVLKDVISDLLLEKNNPKLNLDKSPSILFVIGVNGAGKTTTIGKIARNLKLANKDVILAAADTFRAAAIDQLKIWGERAGVPVIAQQEGSDPAAVVYDSIRAAKARQTDVLIIDTAGRLHNKVNLMNELAKIFKVIEREYPEAEKEVLLVLDATTGQNGLQQAKLFKEAANITGIVLTKLDGTAKGGIVLAINNELGIPIKLIGVGEGINDLQVFDAKNFADALIGE